MQKLALVLAFLVGLVTLASSQAPPPVPALPDTQRLTTYSLTSSVCNCAVNFALYGDGTDVDQWIDVFVNGVSYLSTDATHGWSLSSATGSLGNIPRPITNAVLTFASAQTGTVAIVGARRPRRLSQFSEGAGVSARQLNQVITDLTATQREAWDQGNRTIRGQPGEVLNPLPPASARANNTLVFDSSGQPIVGAGGSGSLVSASGTPVAGQFAQWTDPTHITGVAAPGGTGNVSNSGTPTSGQIASWVDSTHIAGITNIPVTNLNGGTGASSSTFWRGDGTWAAASGGGGGNVSNVGTPTNGQIAIWTDATHVSGVTNLPPTNLNGGTGASTSTFWRGDGQWATPAGSGGSAPSITGTGVSPSPCLSTSGACTISSPSFTASGGVTISPTPCIASSTNCVITGSVTSVTAAGGVTIAPSPCTSTSGACVITGSGTPPSITAGTGVTVSPSPCTGASGSCVISATGAGGGGASLCGFSGLTVSNGASNTVINWTWNSAVLINPSTSIPSFSGSQTGTVTITLGTSTSTPGGMDGEVAGTNQFVFLYGIYNGTTWSAIGSQKPPSTGPTMPAGPPTYTALCYMGAMKVNAGGNLYGLLINGRSAQYVLGGANLASNLPLISSGITGTTCTGASPTYTAFGVRGAVGAPFWFPPTAREGLYVLTNAAGGASTSVALAPNGSYGGVGASTQQPPYLFNTSSGQGSITATMLFESNNVFHCSLGAGGALYALGWKDQVNAN